MITTMLSLYGLFKVKYEKDTEETSKKMEEQHNSDSLISSFENEIEMNINIHNCRIFGHHHLTDTIRPTLGSQYLAE